MFNLKSILVANHVRFSIIYSIDFPKRLLRYRSDVDMVLPPKNQRKNKLWEVTEQDNGDEDYGEPMMHWKFCAILNWEQFKEFVDHCEMFAEPCSTMGALGAPGFGIGWSPAVSINGVYDHAYQNAYVTPWIEECDYRCSWESMEAWFKSLFELSDLDEADEHTFADISKNWTHYNQLELFE